MSFPTNRKNFREELGLEIWNSGRFAFGRGYYSNDLRIFSVVIPYIENGSKTEDYYVLLDEESSIKERLRNTFFFQEKQLNKLMKNIRFDITKNMHDNIYLKV